ncbi:MAG TPA: hypothetical protein VGH61_10785 [Steroidobacteraceae bacterium]
MSMIKLVLGTALGFLIAQGLLHGLRRLIGWLEHGGVLARARALRANAESTVLGALIRYAAPLGIGAALITLGVWALNDYLAAKSAFNAEASLFDSSAAATEPEQAAPRVRSASLSPRPAAPAALDETAGTIPDPYADPEFQVQRKPHRASGAASLKERLVRKSEARAREALLREVKQHVDRSQYDCEAAEHAGRYLKAGLDVWGFAAWQGKYYPVVNYRGATLERCRGIRNVVASSVDLQSAVAQQNEPDPGR